jgi:hypothetical protein
MSKQLSRLTCILPICSYERRRAFPVLPWRPLAILSELQPHRSTLCASAQHDSPETIQYHHTRWRTAALASSRHLLSGNLLYIALQRGVSHILTCPEVRQVLQRWGECSLVLLFQLPALTAPRLKTSRRC